jgi:hypothetical protein
LRTRRRALTQRYRGQTDAGSWAAYALARLGWIVLVAALVMSAWTTSDAIAASHGAAPDPSPQKAPTAAPSNSPSPDPAPQAAVKPSVPQVSVPSTHVPAVVSPAGTVAGRTTAPQSASAQSSHVTSGPTATKAAAPSRAKHPSGPPAHRRPVAHGSPVSFSFPFAFLPQDLLRLPRALLHAGAQARDNGVLLLLSSVAMAVLAVASFTLFRRLRRLVAR